MNIYDFYTGMSFQAYEWLGAHIEENGVVFRTYAPNAKTQSQIIIISQIPIYKQATLYGKGTIQLKELAPKKCA